MKNWQVAAKLEIVESRLEMLALVGDQHPSLITQ